MKKNVKSGKRVHLPSLSEVVSAVEDLISIAKSFRGFHLRADCDIRRQLAEAPDRVEEGGIGDATRLYQATARGLVRVLGAFYRNSPAHFEALVARFEARMTPRSVATKSGNGDGCAAAAVDEDVLSRLHKAMRAYRETVLGNSTDVVDFSGAVETYGAMRSAIASAYREQRRRNRSRRLAAAEARVAEQAERVARLAAKREAERLLAERQRAEELAIRREQAQKLRALAHGLRL